MHTIATYPADEILPRIGTGHANIRLWAKSSVLGYSVKVSSARMECFRRNQTCVTCGITGTMFALESHTGEAPHLNFYHVMAPGRPGGQGKKILMTKDHVIPRSKGGGNSQDNLQTMCTKCNSRKGNTLPT